MRHISSAYKRQHQRRPDEPVGLADDGEDEVGLVLGEEVQARLGRVGDAAAGLLPRADRDQRLVDVVGLVARIVRGIEEPGQALHLVGLEHVDAERRGDREHERRREREQEDERGQLLPRGAGHEQDRERDGDVHQPGAEVGLRDDDHRRDQREQHDPHRRAPLVQPPGAVDGERPERHDQQDLPELGGLDLEERERDPAARPADRRHGVDDHVERDDQPVQAVLVLAQPGVVDAREHERDDQADRGVDALPLDVVQRVARVGRLRVAPLSVTIEHAISPPAASSSSGSNRNSERGRAGAESSEIWIGVTVLTASWRRRR